QVSKTPAPPPAPLERSMALQLSGAATPAVEQIRGSVAPPAPLEPSAPVVDDSARAHARPALPTAAPRRNSPSQLRAEAELLSRARAYSRTDSSQALAAIAEHAQRFPNGALREERELFMIRLFAESGRIDSAREKLRHLEITSPNSPYRDAARAHIDRAVSSERRSPSDIP
ncbi:MAG TPA: hypothetical protein VI072_13660, partial [Polyangiaceae bacterium]